MNVKKNLTVLIFILVAILVSNLFAAEPEAGADKVNLKLNLKKGQKYGSIMTMDQKISQTMNNQPMNINQSMVTWDAAEVLDVNSSNVARIKITYDRILLKIDGPQGGTIELDSNSPAKEPNDPQIKKITSMYKAMVGQSIIMDYSSKGKIVRIEGFNKMMDSMVEKLAADDPNEAREVKQMMKNFMSEDKMKEMNNGMVTVFPDEPVTIGDTWYNTDSTNLGAGFPIDFNVTYMLKERKNGIAIVDSISKIDMGDKDSSFAIKDQKINMQMSGTMSGTSEIDESTGWTIRNKMSQKFTGVMKMSPNQGMPQGMTIPMTMDMTATIEPYVIK